MTGAESPSRVAALDGLRGVAALIVVISHVSNQTSWLGGILGAGGGQLGVMMFFTLSGYLMGALYLDRPFRPAEVYRYLVRRAARVAPLYYMVVATSLSLSLWAPTPFAYGINSANIWDHLALIRATDVLWTIPVEMQFYLVFVGLWAACARSGRLFLLLCIALAAAPTLLLNDDPRWVGTLVKSIAFFTSGLLLSRFIRTDAKATAAAGMVWSIVFIAVAALIALLYPRIYEALMGERPFNIWQSPLYVLTVAVLLVSAIKAPLARAVLGSGPGQFFGAISYSVYLLHLPVIRMLAAFSTLKEHPALFLIIVIVVTTVVASLVYYFFERPSRHWIKSTLTPSAQ